MSPKWTKPGKRMSHLAKREQMRRKPSSLLNKRLISWRHLHASWSYKQGSHARFEWRNDGRKAEITRQLARLIVCPGADTIGQHLRPSGGSCAGPGKSKKITAFAELFQSGTSRGTTQTSRGKTNRLHRISAGFTTLTCFILDDEVNLWRMWRKLLVSGRNSFPSGFLPKQRKRHAAMTEDALSPFDLPAVSRKKVTADFAGGSISSDGRLLLLRGAECRRGRSTALPAMLRFRMFAIACGYEDADNCDDLRTDPLFKLAPSLFASHHEPAGERAVAQRGRLLRRSTSSAIPSRRRRSRSTSARPAIRRTATINSRGSTVSTTLGASCPFMSTMSRAAGRWLFFCARARRRPGSSMLKHLTRRIWLTFRGDGVVRGERRR